MKQIEIPITGWARAVLFDFDYTLGDSSDAIVDSVNYALERLGAPPAAPAELKKKIGLPLEAFFAPHVPAELSEAKRLFIERANEIMPEKTVLFPGVAEWIERIATHTDLKIAIISTKIRARLQTIVDQFHLTRYISAIVGIDNVAQPKPAPDATLHALQLLGCAAVEAIFIGDSIMDAGSAVSAGVPFVGVTTGTTPALQLEKAGARAVFASVPGALAALLPPESFQTTSAVFEDGLLSIDRLRPEVEITYYKSSGPGGQKKNKTESAVRIRHVPTGTVAIAAESRSQHKNREIAWQRLIDKLRQREERPVPRKPTRPPQRAKEERLREKHKQGEKKQLRKPPPLES